jgi:hypothetical protein
LLLTQFHSKSAGGLRSSEVFKFCSFLYRLEIFPRFRLRIWFIRQITATKSWRPLGCQIHKALRSRNLGKNKCCAGKFGLQKKCLQKTFVTEHLIVFIYYISPKIIASLFTISLCKRSWRTRIGCDS